MVLKFKINQGGHKVSSVFNSNFVHADKFCNMYDESWLKAKRGIIPNQQQEPIVVWGKNSIFKLVGPPFKGFKSPI